MPKALESALGFGHWDYGIPLDFAIRHSDLEIDLR
jgi:hypothetical protein